MVTSTSSTAIAAMALPATHCATIASMRSCHPQAQGRARGTITTRHSSTGGHSSIPSRASIPRDHHQPIAHASSATDRTAARVRSPPRDGTASASADR
ncbi:hypothetical protein NJLHNGOC_00905 [Novacetimonas cocois]|uniref:Uncharacterized protein n=1 Tax=Novacetimonas cocois TaxID=1747507 RepID=A0A365Z1D4_9PROT|nr:hypothetical protein NJLHNGOC_00905 [Novacetimonas cocois]